MYRCLFILISVGWSFNMSALMLVGHRGMNQGVSENSLQAFEKAIEQGVGMIECDVRRCKTGEVIIFHDQNLKRLCGISKDISHLSLKEIKEIRLPHGEQIPTLKEAIASIDKRVVLNIEVKEGCVFDLLPDILNLFIKGGWSWDHFLISSFDHLSLKRFKTAYPLIPIGPISGACLVDYDFYLKEIGAEYAIVAFDLLTDEFVELLRKAKVRIILFVINDSQKYEEWASRNVYGIMSDDPGVISATHSGLVG